MLAFDCFLRAGELLKLQLGDLEIDWSGRSGVVNLRVAKGGGCRARQ